MLRNFSELKSGGGTIPMRPRPEKWGGTHPPRPPPIDAPDVLKLFNLTVLCIMTVLYKNVPFYPNKHLCKIGTIELQ